MRRTLGRRPASRRDLSAWYSAALKAQAASGLSVGAYAERVGVSAWSLYQWRRRLSSGSKDRHRGTRLVEVALARPVSPVATGGLVVRVNEGRRSIEVPGGFDGDQLRRLVTVLESC